VKLFFFLCFLFGMKHCRHRCELGDRSLQKFPSTCEIPKVCEFLASERCGKSKATFAARGGWAIHSSIRTAAAASAVGDIDIYFCNEEHFQRLLVTLAQRNPIRRRRLKTSRLLHCRFLQRAFNSGGLAFLYPISQAETKEPLFV
jgi:hypothetical protein